MAIKLVYITEAGKNYVRNNSENISANTIARTLNVPASEVMNVIIVEKLRMPRPERKLKEKRNLY